MSAFTGIVQTGAAAAKNLGALLRAKGYNNVTRPTMLLLDNPSAATAIVIHFTDSSTVAPSAPTEGIPLSSGAFPARRNLELFGSNLGIDVNQIWIYAASDVPLTVAVANP